MARKMTTNQIKSLSGNETIVHIPLSDILKTFENARSGKWDADTTIKSDANGEDQGSNFASLLASMKEEGQKTPIKVRPKGKKFELIVGSRRVQAREMIAAESKEKNPTIMAIVEEMTDLQARLENTIENTQRDDLSGPDLAWAVYKLQQEHLAAGVKISDDTLAVKVGKSQGYVSKLLRIMSKGKASILADWRKGSGLTTTEMDEICKLDKAEQQAAYDAAIAEAKGEGKKGKRGQGAWFESAKRAALKFGKLLGTAEQAGYLTVDADFDSEMVKFFGSTGQLKLGDKAGAKQLREIADELEKGYNSAGEEPEEKADKSADAESAAAN